MVVESLFLTETPVFFNHTVFTELSFYPLPKAVLIHNSSSYRHFFCVAVYPNQIVALFRWFTISERLKPDPSVVSDKHTFTVWFVLPWLMRIGTVFPIVGTQKVTEAFILRYFAEPTNLILANI